MQAEAPPPAQPPAQGTGLLSGPRRMPLMGGAVAALVILLDQLVKAWALHVYELPRRGHVDLSPVMDLTMVWNRGVSFGMLQAGDGFGRWAYVVFALGASAALAWWLSRTPRPLLGLALGMVIGGAIGNAIDRIVHGAVADFLDFSDVFFPWVFNIADAGISVGVALMLLDSLLARDGDEKS